MGDTTPLGEQAMVLEARGSVVIAGGDSVSAPTGNVLLVHS